MQGESYPIEKGPSHERFYFDSIGEKGTIRKVIVFQQLSNNRPFFNLAFGDLLPDERINDSTDSNNNDFVKIMATVVQAAMLFTANKPNAFLRMQPLDSRRKRLYHAVLARNQKDLEVFFQLFGQKGEAIFPFEAFSDFDIFWAVRKSDFTFEKN